MGLLAGGPSEPGGSGVDVLGEDLPRAIHDSPYTDDDEEVGYRVEHRSYLLSKIQIVRGSARME